MKLIRYLNEDAAANVIKTLRVDCARFLEEAAGSIKSNNFLYRGVHENISVMAARQPRLDNRRPKNTSKKLHDKLNNIFGKKFGWPVRNGVFTAGIDRSGMYGQNYYFFPVGDYKYAWSEPIGDLFGVISPLKWYYDNMELKQTAAADDHLTDFFRDMCRYFKFSKIESMSVPENIEHALHTIVNSYSDSDLNNAISSGNEVTFNCDKYYMVNPNIRDIQINIKKLIS